MFGGAGSEERWYEIRTDGSPSLAQSGAATSPSLAIWNGAISPDRANDGTTSAFGSNMVLGFNASSTTAYPSIQMVSKRGANAQSGFVLVQQSLGPNVPRDKARQAFGCPRRFGRHRQRSKQVPARSA